MNIIVLFLGNGVIREIVCPYSDKNKIKEWLREFYPISRCRFYRESEI